MQLLLHLFAENVWPLLWLFALLELILAIALIATGRGNLLFGMGALAVVAVLMLVVEWIWVTPREQIDAIVEQLARAVREEDVATIMGQLSPQCRYAQLDRDGIRRQAENVFARYDFERISLSERNTRILQLRREATSEFRATVRAKDATARFGLYPTWWRLTFKQDTGGQWKVLAIVQRSGREMISRQ